MDWTMKNLTLGILAFLCMLSLAGFTQLNQDASRGSSTVVVTNNTPSSVRILSPHQGEKLQQDSVSVRYAYEPRQNTATLPTPNYLVRLDGRDPVQTQDTEATFTGLSSGPHTLTVELVDANELAIPNGSSQVQFTVAQQGAAQTAQPPTTGQSGSKAPSTNPQRPPLSQLSPQLPDLEPVQVMSAGLSPDSMRVIRSTADEVASWNSPPLFVCIAGDALLGSWFSARRIKRAK